jgi:hypothetical protein
MLIRFATISPAGATVFRYLESTARSGAFATGADPAEEVIEEGKDVS